MINQRQLLWRKAKSMIKVGIGGSLVFIGIGTWSGNDKFYEQFLSPLICHMDPEVTHKAAIYAAKYHMTRAQNHGDPDILKTQLGKITLTNPVGMAAGFDKNAECISGLARLGFGWIEVGSVTPEPQEGNPKPRVFRLLEDEAVINRYGFNNDGHVTVHHRVHNFKTENPNFIVGVNLGANKNSSDRIEDYCKGIIRFSDCADYFVINISSPNTPGLRELQVEDNLRTLLTRVVQCRNNQSRNVPLYLKISPDITEQEIKLISKVVMDKKTRVDGLVICNTTTSRNNLKFKDVESLGPGGLSGKPLKTIATDLIRKFYVETKGCLPIIGVGGVTNGQDVLEKVKAGASAVQIYSSLAYKGPGIVSRIKTELAELLKSSGHSKISDVVGQSSE